MRVKVILKNRYYQLVDLIKGNPMEFGCLLVILALAAYLRFYRIADYMTFLGDEGRDVLVVKRIIVDHKPTLLGPTASVGGFFLGPIYYYLMIPFLWFFKLDPVGPAIMVALFGLATVYLVYHLGKKFFGTNAGLISACLYAVSPLVIVFSRSSWNPNLVPFFALVYIWALNKAVKGGYRYWFLAGLIIGLGLQLHYLFVFLIPVGVVYLYLFSPGKWRLKNWLLQLAGFIVGWSPFLAFEFRHDFTNLKSLYHFIFFGQETGLNFGNWWQTASDVLFRLYARLIFYFPPPEQLSLFDENKILVWQVLVALTILSSLVWLMAETAGQRKKYQRLLLIWLVFGVGLFIFYQKEIYDYYLGIIFPLPFLLTGGLLAYLVKKDGLRWLGYLMLAGLLVLNWSGRPFRFEPNRQLAQAEKIAAFILEKTGGRPFNFALISGGNSDHAYRYFFEIWERSPVMIENSQVDPDRSSVTDQLIVVCESLPCEPLGHSLWEIAGFGRAEIEGEWKVSVVKVYKLGPWLGENPDQ